MEKEDIIYDLEMEAPRTPEGGDADGSEVLDEPDNLDKLDNLDNHEDSDETGDSDSAEDSDETRTFDSPEEPERSEAEKKIDEMIGQMGAETLLEIILDNRNAACRQIIEEVRAQPRSPIPSGVAANSGPASIFDLAAMA